MRWRFIYGIEMAEEYIILLYAMFVVQTKIKSQKSKIAKKMWFDRSALRKINTYFLYFPFKIDI